MQHLNHVTRRRAVYVWRRRLPAAADKKDRFIQVSLRTREFSTAKRLAPLLNRAFCASILGVKTGQITRAEAQDFFAQIVSDELRRIEDERFAEPQAIDPQTWGDRYLDERARAIALERLAAMGPAAHLMAEDRIELAGDGYDPSMIERVEGQINDLLPECGRAFELETAKLAQITLDRVDLSDHELRALRQIRLTAQAEAISRSDRRQQTTPFFDLKGEEGLQTARSKVTTDDVSVLRPKSRVREGYSDRLPDLLQAYLDAEFRDVDDPAEQKKIEKGRRQNAAVLEQFLEAIDRERLSDIRQEDMHYYVSILDRIPIIYRKSKQDRMRSFFEIIERAEELPENEVGLSGNTINRNIKIINKLLKFARSRGVRPQEELFMVDLRRKVSSDERSARLAFTDEDVSKLSRHSIWSGCHSAVRRNLMGNRVIKDGLYWGPVIAAASGARREEIMGLCVADIALENDIPHLIIQPNTIRRLKNASSSRLVPIHSLRCP